MDYLAATEEFFPEQPGGAGRVAWELAKLMRSRGHRVAFVSGSADASRAPAVRDHEGIVVSRYLRPRLRAWDPRRLRAHVAAAAEAVRRLGGEWDVVHAHTLAPGLGAFAAAGQRPWRIATIHSPAILEQRITWSRGGPVGRLKLLVGQPMLRRAEQALYSKADSMSALSRYTIEQIRTLYGAQLADRVTCIPWWCDGDGGQLLDRSEARRLLGWEQDGFAFFTLRRLVPRMGLDVLLRAARQLPSWTAWRLYIAGEGPERRALEHLAAESGHGSRIRFLGRIDDDAVRQAYRACDAFVLPTRALECFGIIALEALARGRPVIAARIAAIPEMLSPVMHEWLFESGNVADLARVMNDVLAGRLRAPPEATLRAYARRRYSRDHIAELYAAWMERGPRPSSKGPAPDDWIAWSGFRASPDEAEGPGVPCAS